MLDADRATARELQLELRRFLIFRTIIWATDGSEAAEGEGRKLVVVHSEEHLTGRASAYPVLADEEELQAKIRRQVDEAGKEGLDATLKQVAGPAPHAAHAIADAASEVEADVIVIGTRGYAPITGLLIGSVTQRLLHIAPCPVLAVPGR